LTARLSSCPRFSKLASRDRSEWQELFRGFLDVYEIRPGQSGFDRAWADFQHDDVMHALGAHLGGRLAGIAHFVVHASTSAADVCYLQDLVTAPDLRGRGVARSLITAVVDQAPRAGLQPRVLVDARVQRARSSPL
jgi:GNAT superfamily N-acetyltransferase